jgi:uncharacterized membrane protein YjfL (UPF0719 family)
VINEEFEIKKRNMTTAVTLVGAVVGYGERKEKKALRISVKRL